MECSKNCVKCTNPLKKNSSCLTCAESYIFGLDGCVSCADVIPQCAQCDDSKDFFQCLECENEYFLDGSVCRLCVQAGNKKTIGYKYCDSLIMPTQCRKGYQLVQDTSQIELTFICVKNVNECMLLDKDANCLTCFAEMTTMEYKDTKVKKCLKCSVEIPHCQNCNTISDKIICITCKDQSYLKQDVSCVKCSSNCIKCEESGCKKCEIQYILDLNSKTCVACNIPNCPYCQTDGNGFYCTQCSKGYGLTGDGGCWSCQTGCVNCNFPPRNICLGCDDNYYLKLGACIPYLEHCIAGSDSGKCYLCETKIPIWTNIYRSFEVDKEEGAEEEAKDEAEEEAGEEEEGLQFDETTISDNLTSEYYMAVNGYCLLCNNQNSGYYDCPTMCIQDILNQIMCQSVALFGLVLIFQIS